MLKSFALIILCLLLSTTAALAQRGIRGIVYRKVSNERLSAVLVTNLKTKAVAMADELGAFSINAAVGDSLQFSKTDYFTQFQVVNGYDITVFLQPDIKLGEVRVVGQTKRQELNEVLGTYRSKGIYYDGKPPVLSFFVSPLTGIYELFGKDAGRLKRFNAFAKREVEASEVDRRYNRSLVKKVTGLTDSAAVSSFMGFWRPSYEDLKIWADYDLMRHIKTNYDYYVKNRNRGIKLPDVQAPVSLGGPGDIKIKKADSKIQ